MEAQPKTSRVLVVAIVIIVINLVAIDVWVFSSRKEESNKAPTQNEKSADKVLTNNDVSSSCPESCTEEIYQATSSLKLNETPEAQKVMEEGSQGGKEFFIPLGSGVNTSEDWSDVQGAAAYIDSTKYGKIKQVTFEALVLIPHGNQITYVRLYNATDKLVMWKSEMTHEGGQPKLLISPHLSLASGNKLYQVQMKSQLKGPSNLNQSRLHIIVE